MCITSAQLDFYWFACQMVYRINPNQQPLWRNPFEMQLGTGANSVVLGKLSAAQERLIAALYRGIADQQLDVVSQQLGLTKQDTTEVLEQVSPLLLAEPKKTPKPKSKVNLSPEFIAGAFAEIIRASLLVGVNGESVLLSRAERTVHLEDLSRTGLLIAQGLAAAGLGNLISHDEQLVDSASLGPTGYPSQLRGHPRIDALRSILAASPNVCQIATGKRMTEKQLQKIDCAVLIVQQVIEPKRYSTWLSRDVPHIVVTFDAQEVSISPMILPGQTACLFCLEIQRTNENAQWPVIASQLISSNKKFDDSASQLFAAGIVIQKILSRIDKVSGFEVSSENQTGYKLNLQSGEVVEFRWPQQDGCQCG